MLTNQQFARNLRRRNSCDFHFWKENMAFRNKLGCGSGFVWGGGQKALLPPEWFQEQLRAFLEFHVPLGKHNDTCRFSFRIFSNL